MSASRCKTMRTWTISLLLVLLLGHSVGAAAQDTGGGDSASDFELASVVEDLRPEAVLRVSFEEELQLPYLSEPIESSGVLTIRSDGLLIRKVEQPNPTTVVMRGSNVVMRDSTGVSKMDLSTTPEAAVAVSLLRLLIVGDVADMKRRYEVEPLESGDGDTWKIQLTPRREEARKIFTRCTLTAGSDNIRQITLYESDDSVRVIEFDDAKRLSALPEEDRELLKSLGIDVVDQ